MPPWLRARWRFGVLALSTIAIGLLLSRGGSSLPPLVRDVLGDALWAMMIAWLAAAAVPHAHPRRRAIAALAVCWAVELSQLYHTPTLDAWRGTTAGHLILGTDFDPRDLAAYALGIMSALLVESAVTRPTPSAGPAPRTAT